MCVCVCVSVCVCGCVKPEPKRNRGGRGVLPASDEEEEGKDDQQGETSYRRCDDHQNLTLISDIRI